MSYDHNTSKYIPGWLGFMGNGIAPSASLWLSDITGSPPLWAGGISLGDTILSSLKEYAMFYKYARVYASSCHLEVYNGQFYTGYTSPATERYAAEPLLVNCITLPLTVSGLFEDDNGPLVMNSYSPAQLMQYPRMKYRYLGGTTNSTVLGHFKTYGKTKTMLGYSKLEDNQECNCTLKYDSLTSSDWENPNAGWYHYFRFDLPVFRDNPPGSSGVQTHTFRYIVKMKYYVELFGYRFLVPQAMTS